jgi:uncharacterized membrane protein YqhA
VVGFILRFRYLAVVVALMLLVHAIGLLVLGVWRGIHAYEILAQGPTWTGTDRPGIHVAESIDLLLFALVVMVLAVGTASLFLVPEGKEDRRIPAWMRISSISELKLLLWEAILVVLVMASLTSLISSLEELHWGLLVLPSAIFLLSASLYLARKPGPR